MFEKLRKDCFWLSDRLFNKSVWKHYQDIKSIQNEIDYDPKERLSRMLEYAIKHVPFYKDISSPDLSLFPVMTKADYKRIGNDCRSIEFLDDSKLTIASTSGSTGTPLIVYQDDEKKARMRADLIAAHENVGWNLGDHYIFIRNWVSNYKQSTIKSIAQNVENISVTEFNDSKKAFLCDHLLKHPNSVLFGYASSVCDFMNYLINIDYEATKLKLKLMVCDSDELSSKNRQALESTFGCTVINRYDNEENGLLGISAPGNDSFFVNRPSIYFELLKIDSDLPAQPGESGRVVVTDLYNRAMPLIRYDIGDLAVSPDEVGKIRKFTSIVGRKADCLYSTDGKIISAVAISGLTEIFTSIVKYQLVQTTKTSFEFHYIGDIADRDSNELLNRLETALGSDAAIQFIKEKQIPVEKNGKYKTTVYAVKD
ncbi:MAG: hypothetical protein IKZ29_07195 [Clostridiales bacterium]|nr:hypothetical protein [Clostridiales bacterium]